MIQLASAMVTFAGTLKISVNRACMHVKTTRNMLLVNFAVGWQECLILQKAYCSIHKLSGAGAAGAAGCCELLCIREQTAASPPTEMSSGYSLSNS
jgi:hypothetical protein